MGQVIGFVRYDDFVNELEMVRPDDAPMVVRIQDYGHQVNIQSGFRRTDFMIEIAAVHGDDVLVCRFGMGSAISAEEDRIGRIRRNVGLAMDLLASDLEESCFDVRAGLIAAAEVSKVKATDCELWRWEKDEDTEEYRLQAN